MASLKSVKASKTDTTTTRSWTAKPILDPDFTEVLPLQRVYIGILKQRKDTSVAIQSISAILPGFAHLKRCSNGKLLLAPLRSEKKSRGQNGEEDVSEDDLKDQLRERGFDLSLFQDEFQVTEVPAKAPRTKSQAREASTIWPVNFHPDQTIENLLDGSVFDEDRWITIGRIMSMVIEAARLEAIGDKRCTGAAAVVDPEDGRILAVSAARIDRHPMWHAAMLAVDLVAGLHGGGAWRLSDKDGFTIEDRQVRTEDERSVEKDRLRRIKRKYEEETPRCYPTSLLSSLELPAQTPLETTQGRRKDAAKVKEDAEKSGPYLCTGYWAFLLMEPCPMCAMALLHSRVSRIFYGEANRSVGVLGTRAILHTVPGLNHRYQVWSGILERECRQTVEEISGRSKVLCE
ncbi:probable inactive tRNA-specific adenosine deaminase-like protein 3 [Nylanderia fulva]|uniref:probable inactive tRNA-specific adenosine deaminase-like protein 3 n=1 Tax=Nylanderia fulva TaxID=613905 RepID=UPI0010FB7330|nr:probable inactive tRNA-specific adenosine deaminase-like protein 3 [Nylanderia fulva]